MAFSPRARLAGNTTDCVGLDEALRDPSSASNRSRLVASLVAEGLGEAELDQRLAELKKASEYKAQCTTSVGDNVKPLSELVVSAADMWCYLQVAHSLKRARENMKASTFVVGLVAPAGGGKSTLVTLLKMLLTHVLEAGSTEEISLDDFLSSQAERPANGVLTRWDVHSTNEELAVNCLEALRHSKRGTPVELPLFQKATDDRLPEKRLVNGPVEFLLFEGWRVGVHHPNFFAMNSYINMMVFLESNFEAILNFKLECIMRDIANSGYDLYEQYGGAEVVFEKHYFAVARRYIMPVMGWSDIVLHKGPDHHLTAMDWRIGAWQAEKARQNVEDLEAVVIGGGQAGCSSSYFLKKQGISHVVLEQSNEVGHTWLSARWDSFKLVTENSLSKLPDFDCTKVGADPRGFMARDEIAKYIQAFAKANAVPVRFNTRVKEVTRGWGGRWIVELEDGCWIRAPSCIVATGGFHKPKLPQFSSELPESMFQIHTGDYKNPAQLPAGAALVVGSAQSGAQIARELSGSGKKTYLALSTTAFRAPRRVRGKDYSWWMWRMGKFDWRLEDLPESQRARKRFGPNPAQEGGIEVRFREMSQKNGLCVLGKALGLTGDKKAIRFDAEKVAECMQNIEGNFHTLRQDVENFIQQNANADDLQDLEPMEEEPDYPPAEGEAAPVRELDIHSKNITSVIWATGYSLNFGSLVDLDIYDERGYPKLRRGVVQGCPGLFFLGLHWMYKWKSAILLGCAEDAEYVVSHAALRRHMVQQKPQLLTTGILKITSGHPSLSRSLSAPLDAPRDASPTKSASPKKASLKRATSFAASAGQDEHLSYIGTMPDQLYADDAIQNKYETFIDLLPTSSDIAIHSVDRKPLTYEMLVRFAKELDLARFGIGIHNHDGLAESSDRLCTVIPNGPEAAVCFLSMALYCSYAPLNPNLTNTELEFEFTDLPAKAVVVMKNVAQNKRILQVASQTQVPALELTPRSDAAGLFDLAWCADTVVKLPALPERLLGTRQDIALVLHTSGTTKKPKIVPLTHQHISAGGLCIASTLKLRASDVNMNMMPLFHIHGLIINVLASMLTGASTLATPGFNADSVLEWLRADPAPNWYSAVPTMHNLVLDKAEDLYKKARAPPQHSLELIRNCSAALPAWVASRMQEIFKCIVMPTYAMTESMPICSNPRDDRRMESLQRKLTSVGFAGGPRAQLMNDEGVVVPVGREGEVCVQGACVTKGYEFKPDMPEDPNVEAFHRLGEGGKWLRTGDKGFVDEDGHLTLVGRFKEIINRGGEKVSPLAVDEILQQHPSCHRLMAFAMPHVTLGEVVGAVVVLKPGETLSLPELRAFGLSKGMSEIWLPEIILFLDDIPKGSTGKPARINLAGPTKCRFTMQPLSSDGNTVVMWDVDPSGQLLPRQEAEELNRSKQVHDEMNSYVVGDTDFSILADPSKRVELGIQPLQMVVRMYLQSALRGEVASLVGLPLSSIQVDHPLPMLGINSMRQTALQEVLRRKLGGDVPLRLLLESTIGELATSLAEKVQFGAGAQLAAAASITETPLPEFDLDEPFPMMPLQSAYYVGRTASTDQRGAWVAWETRIAAFDPEAFTRAVRWLVERHGMLRAIVYASEAGTFEQRMMKTPTTQFELTVRRPAEESIAKDPAAFGKWREQEEETLLAIPRSSQWQLKSYPLFEINALQYSYSDPSSVKLFFLFDLLIADAVSLTIISRELSLLYQGGESALDSLPPVPLDFRQYCLLRSAEREAHAADVAKEEAYWAEKTAEVEDGGLPPCPQLPVLSQTSTSEIARFRARIAPLLWEQFQLQCKRANVTENAALMAAYSLTLATWSSTRHFTMNAAFFNRQSVTIGQSVHDRVLDFVGNSASVVLVNVDFRTRLTFAEAAAAVNHSMLEAVDNSRYVSGVRVMQDLNDRDMAPSRAVAPYVFASALGISEKRVNTEDDLNPHLFNWYASKEVGGPDHTHLSTPQVYIDQQVFCDLDGALLFNWDYAPWLFPDGLVETMFRTYCRFLENLARDSQLWGEAPVLVPQQDLESRANVNTAEEDPELLKKVGLIHDPVLHAARTRPDDAAVFDAGSGRTLSFGELHSLARAYAGKVMAVGGTNPNPVGVVIDKCWEQVVAVMGALLSGRAYAPMSTSQPASRISSILEILSAPACFLKDGDLGNEEDPWQFPAGCSPIYVGPALCMSDFVWTPLPQTRDNLAYVIFTSGSTGTPKGVEIPHVGGSNTCLDINSRWNVGPGDAVLSLSQLSFDLSVWDLFGVLPVGGGTGERPAGQTASLILPDMKRKADPAHWLDVLEQQGATVWNTAPPVLTMLLEYVMQSEETHARFSKLPLRLVMLSGDFIPLSLPKTLCNMIPGIEIYSLGGATEVSIWSCWYGPVDGDRIPAAWTSIPYGFPLANQSMHILTDQLEPTPEQVVGEICFGGVGLARGYWGDAEKTRAAFQHCQHLGQRIYKAGDLGRILADNGLAPPHSTKNAIEVLGRKDFQIKINGYRVEIGEVEAAIAAVDAVKEALVLPVGARGKYILAAFVEPAAEGQDQDEVLNAVMQSCQQRLPKYMIPAKVHILDPNCAWESGTGAWPLSPNGKKDRKALIKLHENLTAAGGALERVIIQPRSSTEQLVTKTLAEVIGAGEDRISVYDDFFELGLRSNTVVSLAARLNRELANTKMGGHLEPSQVYEYHCVAELAELLGRGAEEMLSAKASLARVMQRGGHRSPFFCVAPISGLVLVYRELSRAIGADQPFYGLEHPGVSAGTQPAESVEAIAERLLEDVLMIMEVKFPGRSLQLGGWSMGGIIALEMARQLRKREHSLSVDTVLLIDSLAPVTGLRSPSKAEMVRSLAADLTSCRTPVSVGGSDDELNSMDSSGLCAAVRAAVENAVPDWGWDADLWQRVFDVYSKNSAMLCSYAPKLSDCPELQGLTVHLVRATRTNSHLDIYPGQSKPDAGWSSLFGLPPQRVLLYYLEGDHYLVTNPAMVLAMGRLLSSLLGAAQDWAPVGATTTTKLIETTSHQHWSPSPKNRKKKQGRSKFRIASGVSQDPDPKCAVVEAFTSVLKDLNGPPDFVLLAANAKFDPHKLCGMLKRLSPDSEVIATSSSAGCINQTGLFSVGLLAISDPSGRYAASIVTLHGPEWFTAAASKVDEAAQAKQAGKDAARGALAKAQTIDPPSLAVLTCTPGVEEDVLEGIAEVLGNVPIIGGTAADDDFSEGWWVASSHKREVLEVASRGVAIALLWPSAKVELLFSSCYTPTAARGKVTKVSGRTIFEIDGRPAAQVYSEWTGSPEFAKLLSEPARPQPILPVTTLQPIGLHLEGPSMMTQQGDAPQCQFNALIHPGEIAEGDALKCMAGGINVGDELIGMQADKQGLVNHINAVISKEMDHDAHLHGALVVYCGGCALQIRDSLPEVARSFGDAFQHKPFLGLFSFGEQGVDPWERNRHGNLMFSCLAFRD